MAKKGFSPVVLLHRSIFVGLCNEIATRQEARDAWTKIGKGKTVDERFMRRWRVASNLLKKQVGTLTDKMLEAV